MSFEGVHRVGHIGIWVSNIDKSLDWYRNVVGLKLTGLWGEPYRRDRQCFVRCEDWHHDIVFFKLIKQKIEKVLINQILEKGTRLEFIILLLKFLNGRTG